MALTPSEAASPAEVVAAGGLVVRPGAEGPEVLLVHRPRYDDWSFPKGKQDPGESEAETALREVTEETGFSCTLGPYLGHVRYHDHKGRSKVVHYWQMTPAGEGVFEPDREVDAIRWCDGTEAATLLSYAHDRALLARLEA